MFQFPEKQYINPIHYFYLWNFVFPILSSQTQSTSCPRPPRLCLPSPWDRTCKSVAQKLSARMSIKFIYLSLLQSCQRENISGVGEGFNTSQSATYGILLVRCCCCCCCRLAGTKDTRTRSGRATGHRSPASLKSISWQPTGGKRKHPGSLARTLQSAFSRSILYVFSPCQLLEGPDPGLR